VAIELRTEEGKALAKELIARADVVMDNFLPSQREALLDVPEDKIHCSITGYDPDTPEANRPGYDLLSQAGGGLMAITGEPGGEPMKTGVALTDVLTAHYAHGAILAALYAREKTGRGQRLEISLFSATVASLVNVAQGALVTGQEARRYGNAHPSIVPYQVFDAADRPFAMGGATDRHYRMLCERVLERPELATDERFATNRARVTNRHVLVPLLQELFRERSADEWVQRCLDASIPSSLVRGVLEALRSETAQPLIASAGEYEVVRHPVRFDGERLPVRTPAPRLGEHTEAVRRELAVREHEQRDADGEDERHQPGHETEM
jgi:crotonobetainyl-CoA:carnitine CoA-transferase CaiB-like acyl-CoA transferase